VLDGVSRVEPLVCPGCWTDTITERPSSGITGPLQAPHVMET
jgi:hypothetical protein